MKDQLGDFVIGRYSRTLFSGELASMTYLNNERLLIRVDTEKGERINRWIQKSTCRNMTRAVEELGDL